MINKRDLAILTGVMFCVGLTGMLGPCRRPSEVEAPRGLVSSRGTNGDVQIYVEGLKPWAAAAASNAWKEGRQVRLAEPGWPGALREASEAESNAFHRLNFGGSVSNYSVTDGTNRWYVNKPLTNGAKRWTIDLDVPAASDYALTSDGDGDGVTVLRIPSTNGPPILVMASNGVVTVDVRALVEWQVKKRMEGKP